MLDQEILLTVSNLIIAYLVFGATDIVKNSDEEKYVYRGYRITFDSAGSSSFDNDFAKNVIIFGVDNSSSSSHSVNCKK